MPEPPEGTYWKVHLDDDAVVVELHQGSSWSSFKLASETVFTGYGPRALPAADAAIEGAENILERRKVAADLARELNVLVDYR